MDTDERGLVWPRPPAADHAERPMAERSFDGSEFEPRISQIAQMNATM